MQVRWAHFFPSNPQKHSLPDNTAWVRRFPPETSAVVSSTLSTQILYCEKDNSKLIQHCCSHSESYTSTDESDHSCES
jgi:hypothetical protein